MTETQKENWIKGPESQAGIPDLPLSSSVTLDKVISMSSFGKWGDNTPWGLQTLYSSSILRACNLEVLTVEEVEKLVVANVSEFLVCDQKSWIRQPSGHSRSILGTS